MADLADRTIVIRGVLAAVVAATLNAGLVASARGLAIAPDFEPIDYPQVVFLSVLGAIAASSVFAVVRRLSSTPRRTFVHVAAVALVLSLVPDLLLLQVEPTATVPGVLVLVTMHVVAAVVIVGVLTRGVGGLV